MSLPSLNDVQQYDLATVVVKERQVAQDVQQNVAMLMNIIQRNQPEVSIELLEDLVVDIQLLQKKYQQRSL